MYTKVWFPGTRYAYDKCIPVFDFLQKVMLITNVYQSFISHNKVCL